MKNVTKITRHYYALSDSFTGDYPKEFTQGFANSKEVIAFTSRSARDEWVSGTRLTTARSLTRREAIRLVDWEPDVSADSRYDRVKRVRVCGSDCGFIVIAGKCF